MQLNYINATVLLFGPERIKFKMYKQGIISFFSSRIKPQLNKELIAVSWFVIRSNYRLADNDNMIRSNLKPAFQKWYMTPSMPWTEQPKFGAKMDTSSPSRLKSSLPWHPSESRYHVTVYAQLFFEFIWESTRPTHSL